MLISEEVCATCEWARYDSDGVRWCGNPKSHEHLEEVNWNQSCDLWEESNEQ